MYCIYSGKEIDASAANPEHIIPLSLGGCDQLCIQVEKQINSRLGSEVDGKLSHDFFVALDRIQSGTKGHSGKAPTYRVPHSRMDGQPVITTFEKDRIKLYDPIAKTYLNGPNSVQMSLPLDLSLRIRFTAKVALATGYFLFGDRFVQNASCDALRTIMLSKDLKEAAQADPQRLEHVRFYDFFTQVEERDKPWMDIYKLFCEATRSSNILWSYSPQSIIVHVGILGKFVGCVNFPANVEAFPTDGDYWLGHVLVCQGKELFRCSWRSALLDMCENLNILPADQLEAAKRFGEEWSQ